MGLVTWILFGALAGWLASIVAGRNERQGCFGNIAVGIIGALIGGALLNLLTGRRWTFHFNLASLIVAVLGAIILLYLLDWLRRRTP